MTKKTRVIALLLCIALVTVAFIGCAKEVEEPEVAAVKETEKESTEPEVTEEPVVIEEITWGTNNFYSKPDFGDLVEDLFYEQMGTRLNIEHIPKEGTTEKMASMFLSGDIQDFMDIGGEFYNYVVQGYLVDVAPYINNNTEISKMVESNPDCATFYAIDDEIYALAGKNYSTLNIWYRKDWLKQSGLAEPTDMDSFLAMLRDFKEADYDGNGKVDTIPLTMVANTDRYDMFAAYFGTRNTIYLKDGVAVDPITTPEYKEYLEFMKSIYDEGLVDKQISTNTSWGGTRNKFYASEAGSITMWNDIYDSLTKNLIKNGIEGYDNVAPVMAFDNPNGKGSFGHSFEPGHEGYPMTTNALDAPQEKFDLFMNWFYINEAGIMLTSRGGIEGYNYDVVGDEYKLKEDFSFGFNGQSFPPVNLDYKFPCTFDKISQGEKEYIEVLMEDYSAHENAQTQVISVSNEEYSLIKPDWIAVTAYNFHNYILGQLTYDELIEKYEQYKKEIDLDNILANIK